MKYSAMFNVVFVTMLYGVGIPMLFPIAIFNLIIQWLVERYAMAYSYPKPPSLDDRLTKNANSILKWCPMMFLFNGYWMLNNQQMFKPKVITLIPTSNVQMETNHYWNTVGDVDQAIPVLMIAVIVCILFILKSLCKKNLRAWGFAFGNPLV